MKKILCIDYGTKRIGLAVASTPLSEPFKIISAHDAIQTIKDLCDLEDITDIVTGISEGKTRENTLKFIGYLSSKINIPIYQQDETLSSHEVKEHFLHSGVKKSKLHGHIDHYSAALILQDYIDENHIF